MQNQIEVINKNIEKSNVILKKFKLLYKNNVSIADNKTLQVSNQLIEHLTSVYNFNNADLKKLIESYKTDKEIINNLGGKEIANYISECLDCYLKTQGN